MSVAEEILEKIYEIVKKGDSVSFEKDGDEIIMTITYLTQFNKKKGFVPHAHLPCSDAFLGRFINDVSGHLKIKE